MSGPDGGSGGGLQLVGAVAQLLNAGLKVEAALAGVAEILRLGLPLERVTLWVRSPGTPAFRVVSSPPAFPGAVVERLPSELPELGGGRRFPLEHEGARLGVLDVVPAPGPGQLEVLAVVAELLAPYLAWVELSFDLAGEMAIQSREIEGQRRLTSLIIDSLPVGLYVVDREYRIQSWNRKRETGTQGLRREDVVGRPVFDVLTRQPAEQLRAEFDRVFETGEIQYSEIEVGFGGETRHYRLSKIPMRLDGDAITHVITIGEDVTDRHKASAQILQSEKLAAIGQLAAGVMHEINNPLATISASVAAIQGCLGEGGATGGMDEYLEIIDKEVDRCSRIVGSLLDFSRPKATSKAPTGLNAILEDALFLVKHHRRFKRLVVVKELDPTDPRTLADPEQLVQVLLALMLNAVDAMEGGGELMLRTGRNPRRRGEVLLEVRDTGVGIPPDHQSQIFEPFFTTKPPGRGTGLGLSVCYGIVENHRGRIEVESAPGRGSTFRVLLPELPP